jgi:Kdo2-lipid IVA lauroyltransferase/acyltransferase
VPQFYLIPKKLARKAPVLVAIAQWLEARLFALIFWFIHLLSLEQASRLAGFTFGLVGPWGDKAAKARANLAVAFPDSSPEWREQTSRQIFRNLGYSAAELIKLEDIWDQREQRLEFVIQPLAAEVIEQKRAAVYVTAHVGAWQVTNLLSLQYGLTISTIYAPESNPVLRDMMLKLRESFGVKLVPSDAGVRPLLKELAAGHSIGMAMDTRLDTGELLPYFGRDALTNTTGARLALRSGAALLPIRAERLPGSRYRITVYDPLNSDLPNATPEEQAIGLSVQINRCFEAWIRESPQQWICLKRRWPKAHRL